VCVQVVRRHVFPLYLGIIVAGVGVQRSVTAATRHALSPQESLVFAGAAALMMLAMSAIDAASAATTADSRRLAASPLAMVSAVFVACAAQLALSPGSRIRGSTGSPVAAHRR